MSGKRPGHWKTGVAAGADFAFAATLRVIWVAPRALGEGMVRQGVLAMLLEFIVMHAGGFLGAVAMAKRMTKGQRTAALLGLPAVYSLCAGAFCLAFATWWPLLTFWVLLFPRVLDALPGRRSDLEKGLTLVRWGVSFLLYMGGAFATALLPVPRFGIAEEGAWGLPGSGVWIDEPHRVLAFGVLYYAGLGTAEILMARWLGDRPAPLPGAQEPPRQ
jgi:hypothetical protein